jgi:hypothetical protein
MGPQIEGGGGAETTKTMALRYAGRCRDCGTDLPARTVAIYDRATKTVQCRACHATHAPGVEVPSPDLEPTSEDYPGLVPDSVDSGTAGASARREFDRRHARREERVHEAHPHLGGLILALSDDPQSTRAWDAGARGEEALGRGLDQQVGQGIRVLHDRRIRGTRANIDHIVIAPSGVYAVDAKRYAGKRPSLRVEGGFLRPRVEKLVVGGSDKTKLVDGSQWQVDKLREALDDAGFIGVPVVGVLCFLDADWPLLGGSFAVDGIAVLWPRALYKQLSAPGPLDADAIAQVHRALAAAFPVA